MANLAEFKKEFKKLSRPEDVSILQRFFKTGPGQYGEGDIFAGIKVPPCRALAKKYQNFSFPEIQKLLSSKIHEERSIALMILCLKYKKGDEKLQAKIFKFYFKNRKFINNWDLVDGSAPYIVGHYLATRDRGLLYKLVNSKVLWERRIAMIATFYFIRQNDFSDALQIAELLLRDKHDLMHKAVGWMLREIGKRDLTTLKKFLNQHATSMPRTTLRYAIERFPERERQLYLKMKA